MLLHYKYIKPFVPNAHFLHSLKTSENDVFLFSGDRERVHWEQIG